MSDAGAGAGEEEAAIERQLEHHLNDQKETLSAVVEALTEDPSNPDLLAVHEELLSAIKDAEEGLLHLKRSRLLREADALFSGQETYSVVPPPPMIEESRSPRQVGQDHLELETFSVGSRCRFRHIDGRWYNGQVVGLEDSDSARISFLTPTTESMLMCKFFLQQRCRFANNCRMSHGFSVPISSLKEYLPTIWEQSLVGSTILADSGLQSGIWRKAELESWNEKLDRGQVVFKDDGSSAELGTDAISITEYAEMNDTDEDAESSSDGSDSFEEEEDAENETDQQGLGFMEANKLLTGVQTETIVFAKWENHTRGIASKMMASMGYHEGMGLGISGQGITNPVLVKAHRGKQSLEHALASNKAEETASARIKKRSRGGKRKREKKFVEASRSAKAAKAEEEQTRDVFSFINNQLAGQDTMNVSANKQKKGSSERGHTKKEDRRSLVAYDDEARDLRNRVEKLEEMVKRNRKDKAVYEAASRKLSETRMALADAEAAHASASNAVVSKEKEKRWLKF